uniref:EGF-like domain-containing protein n=1 Tax=Macrostomum lignano TaxID=282301 RepID=A0A1I8J5E7_9PLAT
MTQLIVLRLVNKIFICLLLLNCTATATKEVKISDERALNAMLAFFALERQRIDVPLSDLPDGHSVEDRVLSGLAYVPLADQPIHALYAREGFPDLKRMFSAPVVRDGSRTYPAIPSLDAKRNKIYFRVFGHSCTFAAGDAIISCELVSHSKSPTELIDMFGYLALRLVGSANDVYMRFYGVKVYQPAKKFKRFVFTYEDERNHPRILWPAWVNLYLFFRNSYQVCLEAKRCGYKTDDDCANFFSNVNQLSLTYAYFVCRILSGSASDSLCPNICRFDPCATIHHAIKGTCYPISLKIHRHDYFCFCEEGYRAYQCQCFSSKYIRWVGKTGEECRQWIPSLWHDRSQRCGYDFLLARPDMLVKHCNQIGCTEASIRSYIADLEAAGHACGGLGSCSPGPLNMSTDMRMSAYCQCKLGKAGKLCESVYASYVEWTPWTVCYDKGLVLAKQRGRLRFRHCQELHQKQEGSPPLCVNGKTEQLPCPDVAEHLEETLTHSDYGVTSQAVISMWRIVELLILTDLLLVGMLTGALIYHRIVLGGWGVEEPKAEKEADSAPQKA